MTAAAPTACPECGAPLRADDRFCEACGARLVPIADGESIGDRREIDAGVAGGLTNTGLVKRKNQDALYLQQAGDRVVAVVCDGVSSSVAADAAARVACAAAGRSLTADGSPSEPAAAMRTAIAVAQRAVLGLPWAPSGALHAPSCTFLAALWDGRQITVGSVGDSRAYWIDADGARRLTDDDSWVRDQVDAGAMTEEEAEADPRAHQITRWLGDDAPDEPPAISTFVPDRPGWVAVCTDGFWNYVPASDEVARLVRDQSAARAPLDVARTLVDHALARGGHDNVTVAVIDVMPAGEQPPGGRP
ncbi:MAG TPA: PP2C family serine/threonine-protein phosphatase [Acidimicrobiia bacterium]|nr:PP2C family serine/threonine-protein phosphatase [Acidimicrobiia bacterium]